MCVCERERGWGVGRERKRKREKDRERETERETNDPFLNNRGSFLSLITFVMLGSHCRTPCDFGGWWLLLVKSALQTIVLSTMRTWKMQSG